MLEVLLLLFNNSNREKITITYVQQLFSMFVTSLSPIALIFNRVRYLQNVRPGRATVTAIIGPSHDYIAMPLTTFFTSGVTSLLT